MQGSIRCHFLLVKHHCKMHPCEFELQPTCVLVAKNVKEQLLTMTFSLMSPLATDVASLLAIGSVLAFPSLLVAEQGGRPRRLCLSGVESIKCLVDVLDLRSRFPSEDFSYFCSSRSSKDRSLKHQNLESPSGSSHVFPNL